jgi:GNAT superfamily N-acetyltransferase/catechol 2,3-dioxygenase-like lactoylglutathione lyase family enzyme
MRFKHVVPILYSSSVVKSLAFYTEILSFENKWDWGNPPTFGGVSKDGVEVFFCENGQGNPGTWLSLMIDQLDAYYESIKSKGAKIIEPPGNRPWGLREMLVEDPDGHKIRFGQHVGSFERDKSAPILPATIRIRERMPTVIEYRALMLAVGWTTFLDDPLIEKALCASIYAVVAEDSLSGETIGCALLLGDNASFYYIKDVMVRPDWQSKRIGSALLQTISRWLDTYGVSNSMVGLITGENLEPFYRQFGFRPVFGMQQTLRKKNI